MDRRDGAMAALLLAAVAQAVLDQGGFRPDGRLIFGGLAVAALLAAIVADRHAAARAARAPASIALWLLAALGACSAAWTVALTGDALRWGLVTFGYGSVLVAATVLTRRAGRTSAIATAILALATVSALIGLGGSLARTGPFADYVRGRWAPGGTLEYADAMALLAVSALPAALSAMCARRTWIVAAGTFCGIVLASVLALDLTRLQLAIAVVIAAAAVARPHHTVRSTKADALGAVLTLAIAALGVYVVAGGTVAQRAGPHVIAVGVRIVLVWILAAAVRLVTRPRYRTRDIAGSSTRLSATRTRAAAVAAAAALAVAALVIAGAVHAPGYAAHGHGGGFWHGRLHVWRIAIDTAEKRPLAGHGADSFVIATIVAQHADPVVYAHDLPLELAVELGIPGLLLALALYAGTGHILWRARHSPAGWLLAPAAAAFLAANLVDWPWHLAGSGAVWAAAAGAAMGTGRRLGNTTQ